MNKKREEKALFEFKHIMDDLMQLLGKAVNAKTGYLYWVNRSRNQFVLETTYTTLPNVMFQDRVGFEKFFLNRYRENSSILQLEIGRDIRTSDLQHYFEVVPAGHLTLIPFQNNGETVAITVLETERKLLLKDHEDTFSAYKNAHMNVLNTYLELTDLYDDQNKWVDYDESLEKFSRDMDPVEILDTAIEQMQKLLPDGGVSVALRGMETWVTVLRSSRSPQSPVPGLMIEHRSMAYDALQKNDAVFSMHFNQNPKRVSASESSTEGATLAIPMLLFDRRHAVVLAYDKNPLIFTESTKYQLKNLVRIAALTMQSVMEKMHADEDLFTSVHGSFTAEIWELCLKKQLNREQNMHEKVWFGMIGIENTSEIRSRFRLEELKKIQRMIVKALNPSRLGFNGMIGFNSDYVYSYLLYGATEEHHKEWLTVNMEELKNGLDLGDGRHVSIRMKAGSKLLSSVDDDEAAGIISDARQALNQAMKRESKSIINF
jgi:hypothetical protein